MTSAVLSSQSADEEISPGALSEDVSAVGSRHSAKKRWNQQRATVQPVDAGLAMETSKVKSGVRNQADAKLNQLELSQPVGTREPAASAKEKMNQLEQELYGKRPAHHDTAKSDACHRTGYKLLPSSLLHQSYSNQKKSTDSLELLSSRSKPLTEFSVGKYLPHYSKLSVHLQPTYHLYLYLSSAASKRHIQGDRNLQVFD
ncbi:Calcium-transporting ATPase 2, plasma membrane-type [Dorcoceras hygrometricum]|uniref:Calcium-transporting ATPase 2, plasma membrane-type n=1 Tax=Dorcoceras hygrometricum TaxID=472368 RepID=A0A2Z7D301_9LAMI|nr:Calcium-transporting ATPase 2, plasma membrane-type [Dorcoceras hygrometricum]